MRAWAGEWDTETAFTRQFMQTLPKKKARRATFDKYLQASPPLLVKPGYIEDAVYIDLSSAYPSLYKLCGWGVEYERGKFYVPDQPLLYPYPQQWKAGRSFVVTGSRHVGKSTIVNNGSVFTRVFQNPYSNPQMVAFVWDALSMIARFAEYATGAKYWNMDGGIMPVKGSEIFTGFLDMLGLEYKIKARGQSTIVNAACWNCGSKATAMWMQKKPGIPFAGDRITLGKQESEWLFWRMRK